MQFPDDLYRDWSLARIHADWSILVGQQYRMKDEAFRGEVLAFARQVMRKASEEFSRIADNLQKEGYNFVFPDRVMVGPEAGIESCLAHYRRLGIHFPVAFEAWLIEVGAVNLMGSHPGWERPGYIFDGEAADPLLTDPFVCELPISYLEHLYDEHLAQQPDGTIPFKVAFSPDYLHKANLSGGPPYQLSADEACVDALVFNEPRCISFTALVRLSLRWRGFAGFESIPGATPWSEIERPKI